MTDLLYTTEKTMDRNHCITGINNNNNHCIRIQIMSLQVKDLNKIRKTYTVKSKTLSQLQRKIKSSIDNTKNQVRCY